ncbi:MULTISPECIES: MFS transporter [unclassified Streptomyces]|uniref:MFS transporter n=1 Tax=unclassified Streptomyces TaxID=2593676 RepID=UPI002DDBD0AA|nr:MULTISPECIES: MFS transporter [unclassified Streptomyces]WSD94460.1 MFS transporter [Streptomyces sp. NBC_01474]
MSTATTASVHSPAPPDRSALVSWLAVISVMLGIFSIVTTEILPIGLLTSIGSSFTISDGMAGLMMTMPGFLAAVSAPLVTVATGRIDRRVMLGVFILLLALANFLAAIAQNYWLVLVSRVMVGVTIGGFWSIGAGLAGQLVPAKSVGRATSVIFCAVPLGSVLGVPLGTFIGDIAGWRTAFLVMGGFTLAVLALLLLVVPPLPSDQATRLDVLGGMLRSVNTRFALVMTFLIVFAHFGTYTYVTPFLEQVTHVSSALITVYLLVYGAAGIAGNFLGGSAVVRYPRATFAAAAALIAGATLLLPVIGRSDGGAVALLIVWGVAYGAVPVCSQTWFAKTSPDSPEASSVLFTASFQATISIGALVGGAVLDHSSPSTVMVLGGLAAVLMVLVAWAHWAGRFPWP